MKINMLEKLKTEIKSHRIIYFLLTAVLLGALFIRVYRTEIILHFFYDQGRDAKEIWELLYRGDFFLIGPTTGIAGIFRGPFYYYLIAPVYWIGNGNPAYPANFLALMSVAAIVMLYYLGFKFKDRVTGLFAATLAGFSFYIMLASRWLSNPTPMLLLSMLFIWQFYLIMQGKRWAWISLSFLAGISLFHFGSSGEFFYFPAILIFTIWQRKHFPDLKTIILSGAAFLFSAAPLILFDIKNDFLLFNNIKAFIFEKESFKSGFQQVLSERIDFYDSVFFGKIFPGTNKWTVYLKFVIGVMFLYHLPELLKNKYFRLVLLVLASPVLGLLFFQGNEGNIYDYYMTGYYLIFILGLAMVLRQIWSGVIGKAVIIAFFYMFFTMNIPIVKSFITDGADGPTTVAFKPQKQAIEWAYADSGGEVFNIDVYVPPVIPHAYDYLFLWYENNLGFDGKVEELVPLLYTFYEEDPPHPERLEAWLERQEGIGEVEYEQKFGGITVQRRKRLQ